MKKLTTMLAAASLFTAGLVSCQKDDTDVTIISSVAGDYVGAEAGPPTGPAAAHEYPVHIYNQADSGNGKVFITNIYEIGGVYEATVNGNNITVASTPYSYRSGTTTYTGNLSATGTVEGSKLTLNFQLDGDLADNCKFVGDRAYRYPTEGN